MWETQGLPRRDWLPPGAQVSGRAGKGPLGFSPGWLSPLGHGALVLWEPLGLGSGRKCHGESPAFGSVCMCPPGSCSRLSCRSRLCLTFAEERSIGIILRVYTELTINGLCICSCIPDSSFSPKGILSQTGGQLVPSQRSPLSHLLDEK